MRFVFFAFMDREQHPEVRKVFLHVILLNRRLKQDMKRRMSQRSETHRPLNPDLPKVGVSVFLSESVGTKLLILIILN